MRIGFIGLGKMGAAMARNLCESGHEVRAWNRTPSKAGELEAHGAKIADRPSDACRDAEVVITMLADDAAVSSIAERADGVLAHLPVGAIHLSCSTISIALAERLSAAHRGKNQRFVSAPVFGRPDAAEAAKLFVVAGGERQAIEACAPVFQAVSQRHFVAGDRPAQANLVKLCGNFLLASVIEGLSETMALVRKDGMDPQQFLEILTQTIFPAPVYKNYGTQVAQEKYEPAGFGLKLGLKDVRLALDASRALGAPLPFASVLQDHLLSAVARGYGDWDWSALGRIASENAGLAKKS